VSGGKKEKKGNKSYLNVQVREERGPAEP